MSISKTDEKVQAKIKVKAANRIKKPLRLKDAQNADWPGDRGGPGSTAVCGTVPLPCSALRVRRSTFPGKGATYRVLRECRVPGSTSREGRSNPSCTCPPPPSPPTSLLWVSHNWGNPICKLSLYLIFVNLILNFLKYEYEYEYIFFDSLAFNFFKPGFSLEVHVVSLEYL